MHGPAKWTRRCHGTDGGDSRADDHQPATMGATLADPDWRDQRGVTRPQGAMCDVGAFELEQ